MAKKKDAETTAPTATTEITETTAPEAGPFHAVEHVYKRENGNHARRVTLPDAPIPAVPLHQHIQSNRLEFDTVAERDAALC